MVIVEKKRHGIPYVLTNDTVFWIFYAEDANHALSRAADYDMSKSTVREATLWEKFKIMFGLY